MDGTKFNRRFLKMLLRMQCEKETLDYVIQEMKAVLGEKMPEEDAVRAYLKDPGKKTTLTVGQQVLAMDKLLEDAAVNFHMICDMVRYEDYTAHPTKAHASSLITLALEEHWKQVQQTDGYMKYIATRPRAERLGDHGLFSDADRVDLDAAMSELEHYTGNVWTHILSLHREDAERLGYNNAQAWRALLRAHRNDIAAAMHIPPQDFRWYAAFHKLPLDQRDEAAEDLERLAESGDVHAQYFLGLLYRDGGLLLPDAEQAVHWLELAAKENLPAAQYALGKLYLSDDPEVHDVDDGLQWLERAAQNGNTDAAYRLGKEYLTGKFAPKDAVKAAEYLRYAADQNHPWANYLLGKLYLTGNGVPKDEEAAWNCFRMANAYGHPYAQYVLERQEQWRQPELLFTVSRLLYHMSNIFRDNAPALPAQPRLHIDRKRMRDLQELRIALGHQPDDHEEEQTQTQSWGGMTMKGW